MLYDGYRLRTIGVQIGGWTRAGEGMDVFNLRGGLIEYYQNYADSFIFVADGRMRGKVEGGLDAGILWPEPLVRPNASFESGGLVDDPVVEGLLHLEYGKVFLLGKDSTTIAAGATTTAVAIAVAATTASLAACRLLGFHRHQNEAVRAATTGANCVLITGTGSGKSLAYIIPIVDHVLRLGLGCGVHAIVIYPMNGLPNSQAGELEKFLCHGYPGDKPPVTFQRYTGQEGEDKHQVIILHQGDIILTNYVMPELMRTRPAEKQLLEAAGIRFLVLDELHTCSGRQGTDVGSLVRRARPAGVRWSAGGGDVGYPGRPRFLQRATGRGDAGGHAAVQAGAAAREHERGDAKAGERLRRAARAPSEPHERMVRADAEEQDVRDECC